MGAAHRQLRVDVDLASVEQSWAERSRGVGLHAGENVLVEPRLLRSAQSAKGFLIPDDDPSIAILDKLEQMSEEIRRIHVDSGVESLAATWGGPGWLGRLAVRRG